MANIMVRNLEESVKNRIQRRARRHGRSMEEEVRDILRNAAQKEEARTGSLGSEIAELFRGVGLETDIEELHGRLESAEFER